MADLSRRPDGHFTIHLDPGDNTERAERILRGDAHTRPCDASASGRRPAERPCVGDRVLEAPTSKPESAPR